MLAPSGCALYHIPEALRKIGLGMLCHPWDSMDFQYPARRKSKKWVPGLHDSQQCLLAW